MSTHARTAFSIIYADPAWPYEDALTMAATKRGAASNYQTMSVEQICDLYQSSQVQHIMRNGIGNGRSYVKRSGLLADHPIADDAICLLWVTKDVLLEGVGQRVMNNWGFTPKQIVPWVKGRIAVPEATTIDGGQSGRWTTIEQPRLVLQTGMGRIFRNVVEYLLVGARGKYSQLVLDKGVNGLIFDEEVILEPRGRHSAKPEIMYSKIERMFPGPYLELFARNTRPGWTSWGNQIVLPDGSQFDTTVSVTVGVDGEWLPPGVDPPVGIGDDATWTQAVPETVIEWP